jgi:hypothetical protein
MVILQTLDYGQKKRNVLVCLFFKVRNLILFSCAVKFSVVLKAYRWVVLGYSFRYSLLGVIRAEQFYIQF